MPVSAGRSKRCTRDASTRSPRLLALHYERSEDADKAVDYAILAAEKAQRRSASAEALTYFETAMRRLDGMPDTKPNRLRRIDAVLKQIEVDWPSGTRRAHHRAGRHPRALLKDNRAGAPAGITGWDFSAV